MLPSLPSEFVDRFGAPEVVFGPNIRFRRQSTIVGAFLVLLGVISILCGLAALQVQWPPGGGLYLLLGGGLLAVGVVALVLPRQVPLSWVYVCPRGLVRIRGGVWEALGWADVLRFEEGSPANGRMVAIQQCRIITAEGAEWGFIADLIADYPRLVTALRRKIDDGVAPDRTP